jgi:drug/metabolite transporter (DMT)-like permease
MCSTGSSRCGVLSVTQVEKEVSVHVARPLIGITLMVVASLTVPIVDGIAKILGATHSPFFVAWARYFVASLVVLPLALFRKPGSRGSRFEFGSNALRTVLTVTAMTCFFFAITQTTLATAFGGYFIGPVVAALLATWLLGERISGWRITAVGSGLAGAFFILKPGAELQLGSLLAILSGVLFAGYLVATRVSASTTPPVHALCFQCVLGMLLLAPFAALYWSWPTEQELFLIALMGAISAICHFMVIAAFKYAEATMLAPLVYLELATAVLFGFLIFSELPDILAVVGIALIVLGGLIVSLATRA